MTTGLMSDIYLFVLAILVGYEVITKAPSTLHTPLMPASNAIHGIVIIDGDTMTVPSGLNSTPGTCRRNEVSASCPTA